LGKTHSRVRELADPIERHCPRAASPRPFRGHPFRLRESPRFRRTDTHL